jgi:hypothetical protein
MVLNFPATQTALTVSQIWDTFQSFEVSKISSLFQERIMPFWGEIGISLP